MVCLHHTLCVCVCLHQERAAQDVPLFHPTPSQPRLASQLSEEEQVRLAQRIGLIQHLPRGIYQPSEMHPDKRSKEYVTLCVYVFVCVCTLFSLFWFSVFWFWFIFLFIHISFHYS